MQQPKRNQNPHSTHHFTNTTPWQHGSPPPGGSYWEKKEESVLWVKDEEVISAAKRTAPIYRAEFDDDMIESIAYRRHPQASAKKGAYYLQLNPNQANNICGGTAVNSTVMLSIGFLVAFGRDEVEWKALDK